ncbi:MAG: Hsp70 family protein, partial [Kiritimatiellae bacterium]|nr:Hsp70 family protein [Kiritimatiellia bacterium]
TGKEQKITITATSGLDKGEIEKMVKDAEQHAADDQQRREGVELKNKADALVYETEKLLKEQGSKIDAAKKAGVETAIEKLKAAIKDGGSDVLRSAMEALNTEMQAVSADLYARAKGAQQQKPPESGPTGESQQQAAPGEGPAKGGDDVIDADFEMVDDKKKK